MKISRNPQIAFQQGIAEGREQRRSNDTICGFEFMQSLLRACMYNANVDGEFLSMPKLADFYEAVQKALCEMKDSYIKPDGTISNNDKIDLLRAHDRFVEKKFEEAKEKQKKRMENKNDIS